VFTFVIFSASLEKTLLPDFVGVFLIYLPNLINYCYKYLDKSQLKTHISS
jgi:hypothetical protein